MSATNNQTDDRVFAMQQVIRNLRLNDLNDGHCFMIFDDELPDNQAYYEYPDGHINVEQLNEDNFEAPRIIISVLTDKEIADVKQKHEVFR